MPSKTQTVAALTQDAVLVAAAGRRYGHVLPLPENASSASTKVAKLLKGMLSAGLIEEHLTTTAKNAWRTDEQGKHILLRIAEAGRQAVAAPLAAETVPPSGADASVPAAPTKAAQPKVPSGKLGQVLAAVRAGQGASIGDLVAMTGWQPHTIRASLTRLRQGGVPIQHGPRDGQKRYFVEAGGAVS